VLLQKEVTSKIGRTPDLVFLSTGLGRGNAFDGIDPLYVSHASQTALGGALGLE
jgi:hypothetical protein